MLQLSKRISNISKIKQISTNFYQIIEKIKNRSIKLFWIPSKEVLADNFIKPLFQLAFKDKQIHIGVVNIEENSWVETLRYLCKEIVIIYILIIFYIIMSWFVVDLAIVSSIGLQNLEGVL